MGIQAAPDAARQISAPRIHVGNRRGHQGHRRAHKKFRGRQIRCARHRHHFTDRWPAHGRDPARLQVAGRRAHDLQDHERSQNRGGRSSRAGRKRGEIGPLDGFVSAKTGNRFPSKIKIVEDEKNPAKEKRSSILATRSTSTRSFRSGPIRKPARNFAKRRPTTSCANATATDGKRLSKSVA